MRDIERLARALCAADGLDWEAQANYATSAGGDDNEQERYYGYVRALLQELRNPSEGMADKGEYVNSEWLNDAAPIGQRRYREPAKSVFTAMIDHILGQEEV